MPTQILNALRTFMHGNGAVLLPELQLLLFAVGMLVMDTWADKDPTSRQRLWNPALALAGTIFSALTLWMLHARIIESGDLDAFQVTLIVDSYFLYFSALFLAATALVILLSVNYPASFGLTQARSQARYYALLLFACMGMMFMVSAVDLFVIFLAVETVAITGYFLAATPGPSAKPTSTAITPLTAGMLGSAILAYAFSLLYGLSGATNIGRVASALTRRSNVAKVIVLSQQAGAHGAEMYQLLQSRLPGSVHWHPFILAVLPISAFILISIGILLKLTTTPFHSALKEAAPGIAAPVLLFLCGAFAVVAIALLMRLALTIFAETQGLWWYIVAALALAMILWGTYTSVLETNLQRLLASSSIAQIGFILLGLVSANEGALTGMSYYLFTYLFILTGAIAVLITVRHNGVAAEHLSDLAGLRRHNPISTILLIVFVLALAGFPPTAGFLGRYLIFRSLLQTAHPVLAWFAAIASIPLAYSYLRIAVYAWRNTGSPVESAAPSFGIPEAVVLGVCVFVSLAAGLYSEPFTRLARYAFGQ
ncbi:MAG TPA: proton-conducting transporter membrane subunit [Candidatus Acidoferrum sp.]|jgi:NADH-quinone oxidoreductase subunit N